MKKTPTVTIGIPVYNEEANIASLLARLMDQRQDGFKVTRIIVVDDASTDSSVVRIQSIGDPRIEVITNEKREGQIYAQNLIFSKAVTDIVVLLEGDTLPDREDYLKELLSPLILDHRIGMSQGNGLPVQGTTLVGKAITYQFELYHRYVTSLPSRARWYTSGRGGRAFARIVYLNLRWPPAVPEDVYAMIWCRDKGIRTYFSRYAVNRYQCSQTYADFRNARRKTGSGRRSLQAYMPSKLINEAYKKPRLMMLQMLIHFLITRPHLFAVYAILKLPITVKAPGSFVDLWPVTYSTKRLARHS